MVPNRQSNRPAARPDDPNALQMRYDERNGNLIEVHINGRRYPLADMQLIRKTDNLKTKIQSKQNVSFSSIIEDPDGLRAREGGLTRISYEKKQLATENELNITFEILPL